ncbi:MAG: S8 family serine peptidase [Candidatus Woesearchaeota archaeon]
MGGVFLRKINVLIVFFILIFSLFFVFATENGNDSSDFNIEINQGVENKIHKDLRDELSEDRTVKVILEVKGDRNDIVDMIERGRSEAKKSKDKRLIFAEIKRDEFNQIALDPNIEKIWLDRKTNVFLDTSVEQIHATELWTEGFEGSDIKIAILDTGIDKTHEMLSDKVILERDFTDESDPNDYHGHGTHIAGIVAGDGRYRGVAPGALILNGKVLDDTGRGRLSWLIDGIDWALDPDRDPSTDDGADIISLSLGATYNEEPEEILNAPEVLKVEEAISRGAVVVIASGNCADGCGGFRGVTTPGISRNAITVGAVDDNNEWLDFSSGDTISDFIKPDLVAPGEDICSSIPGSYACLTGTSMSTPHVAGAVALLLDKGPSLNPHAIKNILEEGALDLGSEGKDIEYGSGVIDLSNIDISNDFDNKNYKLEIPFFEINERDRIKLVYFNIIEKESVLSNEVDKSSGDEISEGTNFDSHATEARNKNNKKEESNKGQNKKIKVIFEIEELDNVLIVEDEKTVPVGKSKEFSFEWTPYFIGKHLLKISLFESEELTDYSEVGVNVAGDFIDRLAEVEVLIR